MTKKEKKNPSLLNASRRIRISKGSGTRVEDINRFMNQYEQMNKIMKDVLKGKNPLGSLMGKRKGFR
jgi:signal recognition particle subunit SRP54